MAALSQRDQIPCPRRTPPTPPSLPPSLEQQQRQQQVQLFQLPQAWLPQKLRGLPGRPSPVKVGGKNVNSQGTKHFAGVNLCIDKGRTWSLPESEQVYLSLADKNQRHFSYAECNSPKEGTPGKSVFFCHLHTTYGSEVLLLQTHPAHKCGPSPLKPGDML